MHFAILSSKAIFIHLTVTNFLRSSLSSKEWINQTCHAKQLFLNYRHCNFVSFLRLIKQKTSRCDTGDEPPTINLESNSQSSHLWLLIMAFAWHDCDETVRGRFITRNLFYYNWRINSSFLARTRSKIDHKFRLQSCSGII